MTIQEQLSWSNVNDDNLSFFKAIGVDYVTINPPPPELKDGKNRTDFWKEMRKRVESHGLKLNNVGMSCWDEITLGRPDQDEEIEAWCTLIRNLGAAGIPTLGYNFKPIGNFRTTSAVGRGGARYSTFDYDEFMQNPPDVPEKHISEGELLANLKYFLERIVPVAEEVGVKLAMHPDDPPIPEPLGGAARILSTLDHFERMFEAVSSHANAMLFCQGCVREMGEDVPTAIRRIGAQGKIAYVHFRNIRGTPKKFMEVFVDEGDVDMYQAMQTYKEVGFEGPFMMDHTPGFPQENAQRAGVAFAVGYIRAMLQAVYR
ncbi:mannonate dehydratase [Candidatus Poribacteria bacterium]|nr:mannonate dehydratase [Candidatus Poribacteria bacterium]